MMSAVELEDGTSIFSYLAVASKHALSDAGHLAPEARRQCADFSQGLRRQRPGAQSDATIYYPAQTVSAHPKHTEHNDAPAQPRH